MPPPQLAPFPRLGYYTYYRLGTRRRARRSAPWSPSRATRRCLWTECECREYKHPLPPLSPCVAPMKYLITNREEDRRMRRAAAVEWTLAAVLFLLLAFALAKLFHAL
jgi:hypothetical protein